ncbi:unnamed protein product [Lasius platythorax]|uniref:Uncharacterized protein n=1 Tax=Lasius platythorax TaxID=488582 RepID=A0AAV2N3H1_9HYME
MFLCRNPPGISQWQRVHEDYRLPSVFKRLRVESLITRILAGEAFFLSNGASLIVTVRDSPPSRLIDHRYIIVARNSSSRGSSSVVPINAKEGNSAWDISLTL